MISQSDKWLIDNKVNIKDFLLYLKNTFKGNTHRCAGSFNDIWHGEIKKCPQCKIIRITDCCACGCGTCYTCGYRWCCTSITNNYLK